MWMIRIETAEKTLYWTIRTGADTYATDPADAFRFYDYAVACDQIDQLPARYRSAASVVKA